MSVEINPAIAAHLVNKSEIVQSQVEKVSQLLPSNEIVSIPQDKYEIAVPEKPWWKVW